MPVPSAFANPASHPVEEWQSLWDGTTLQGWAVTDFAGHGEVEVADDRILLNQGVITGIHYTRPFPTTHYEIELEAQRVMGNDFFCGLTFPVGTNHCTLIVGGWGGTVVGLSSIDGQDASLNETTRILRFETGDWYRIRLQVLPHRIRTWLNDEALIDVDITGRAISLRPGDIVLSRPLGLAAWHTTAAYRNLRWRPVFEGTPSTGSGSRTIPGSSPSAAPAQDDGVAPSPQALRRVPGDGYQPAVLPDGVPTRPLPDRYREIARALHERALSDDFAWRRLADLCDLFGHRFSGSTQLEAAIDWVVEQMRADGLEAVRTDPVQVPRWIRGTESVEVHHPWQERLPMLGLGGSVATPEPGLTAPILVVTNFAELQMRAPEARGRIVVYDVPFTRYGDSVRYRYSGAIEAARAGAIASLVRSIGDFGLRTPHTGSMGYAPDVPRIPHAALAGEDTQRLRRWQERGETPVLTVRMSARTEADVTSRNVIAEWKGWEHPDEVVVIGGHVDSWDVGQGALDDGGGCIAAWEALRLIRELGLRPRRTLRCVLWTNEENGLRGARAYREQHAHELDRHVAAMESDNGAFDPLGFGFTGSTEGLATLIPIVELLQPLMGAGRVFLGGADADTGPLLEAGVPVLGLRVERSRYFWFHHTEADTPDKVDPQSLARCAAAFAIVAFTLADLPEPLPR